MFGLRPGANQSDPERTGSIDRSDYRKRSCTHHGQAVVGGAYLGGGRARPDAEHGVVRRRLHPPPLAARLFLFGHRRPKLVYRRQNNTSLLPKSLGASTSFVQLPRSPRSGAVVLARACDVRQQVPAGWRAR